MNLTLRDCRVSKKYVELDTTIAKSDLDELIDKLSSIGPLDHAKHVVEEIVEKEKAISEGIDYFNNERFGNAMKFLRVFGKTVTVMKNSWFKV